MINDLNAILLDFTNYVANERVRMYNEGLTAGVSQERERCAKIAENELVDGDTVGNLIAKVIKYYIEMGGTPMSGDE